MELEIQGRCRSSLPRGALPLVVAPPPLTYDVIPSPTHMLFAPTPHLCEWCLSPGMNILHVWEGRTKSRPRPWHLSNEREFSTTQFGFGFSSACKMSNLFYFRFIFLCKIDKQIWEGIFRIFNVDINKGRIIFFLRRVYWPEGFRPIIPYWPEPYIYSIVYNIPPCSLGVITCRLG